MAEVPDWCKPGQMCLTFHEGKFRTATILSPDSGLWKLKINKGPIVERMHTELLPCELVDE